MTFDDYVRLRGPALVRLARLITGDRHLGEDLVQEVLIRAYPRWSKIRDGGRPDVYLRRMLVNAHISWRRKRSSGEVADGAERVEQPDRADIDHDVNRLIARSGESSRLTVRGKAAEATSAPGWYAVRWQPVPGLWAQASSTTDLDAAIDLAGRVRLDHVYRCAVPFRLSGPASARLVKCQTTTFVDGRSPAATVWFRVGTAAPEYQVSSYADQPATVTNDTLAGRAVQINHPQPTGGGPLGLEIIYPYGERTGFFCGFYGPDEAVLRSAVTGFLPVTSEDPRSWPSSPFG